MLRSLTVCLKEGIRRTSVQETRFSILVQNTVMSGKMKQSYFTVAAIKHLLSSEMLLFECIIMKIIPIKFSSS